MNQRTAAVPLLAAGIAAVAGCSPSSPPAPSTASSVASSVEVPAPESRSPQLTVEGDATWLTGRPGCIALVTASGQRFQLTGSLVRDNEHRARAGEQPRAQRVRITGYVAESAASPCHMGRAFVVETVTTVAL